MTLEANNWRKVAIAAWRQANDPTIYGLLEIDVSHALSYLKELRRETGVKVTLTALVIKAVAHALKSEPAANSRIRGRRLVGHKQVDIFAQVDLGAGSDLSGVKLLDVPSTSLLTVARELSERAQSLRGGSSSEQLQRSVRMTNGIPGFLLPLALKIQDFIANDLQWSLPFLGIFADPFGSAMVTNVGSLGLGMVLPPIPPICRCSIVCALGSVEEKPVAVNGKVEVRPVVSIGLAIDHRYLDGAHLSKMSRAFQEALQDPARFFGEASAETT